MIDASTLLFWPALWLLIGSVAGLWGWVSSGARLSLGQGLVLVVIFALLWPIFLIAMANLTAREASR